jgi:hypothetical protein
MSDHHNALANVPPPHMLRAGAKVDPQLLGEQFQREAGQAFEWALDQAHVAKGDAAFRMGYTDAGVIGRWISGKETVQMGRARLIGDEFFAEFCIALLRLCSGVEVSTHVKVKRPA